MSDATANEGGAREGRRTMVVVLSAPAGAHTLPHALRLRFDAPDGARGVWPGHEAAWVELEAGAIQVLAVDAQGEAGTYYGASEGGLVWIEPDRVTMASTWVALATDSDGLLQHVQEREVFRRTLEAQARALEHRHEAALQRAFAGLKRESA